MLMSNSNNSPYRIVSSIPGRVRLQFVRGCVRKGMLAECERRLQGLAGVQQIRVAADAGSLIVVYDRRQRPLTAMLVDIETVAARMILPPHSEPAFTEVCAVVAPASNSIRNDRSRIATSITVTHSIPGRLRVRIPWLHHVKGAAQHLESGLLDRRGIHSVEMNPDADAVIVHYDPEVHRPTRVMRLMGRLLRLATQRAPDYDHIERVHDIPIEPPPGQHPLLYPTIAVSAAVTGLLPAMAVGGLLALAALPIAWRAIEGLKNRRANVDQLDMAALLVLVGIGDFLTGSIMTWLLGLADLIRSKTMSRSRRAISELLSPASQQAWVDREGSLIAVSVEQLNAGDIVLVYPGDQIPVDGVITQGQALVDVKILTGESLPIRKEAGEAVFALTTVVDGHIQVKVEHIGRETRAGQVAALIEEAPLSDTRIQNYAALVGDRLVLPIFALAAGTYLITRDLLRMAAILILDFATGIRLSAPTTILSAMTGAARQGLFIKGGKALEKLAEVDAIVFDKTGTLTRGEPYLSDIHVADPASTADEVLRLAAGAEANLNHPAARAIVDAARAHGLAIARSTEMEYALGLGVRACVEDRIVQVGSERYMDLLGIDIAPVAAAVARHSDSGDSMIYVAVGSRLLGLIAYADPPRPESRSVVQALLERGVKRIVMLTGDNSRAALTVARYLGITDVIADAHPEQKADVVQNLRDQGYTVAVIGDGVNDSPAFTRSDVGISVAHGADIAKETADVILLEGDLWGLPHAIDLSRDAVMILRQNLQIVMGPTAAGLVASVAGLANPLISTIINNGTTVLAGLNALRPLVAKEQPDVPDRRLLPAGEAR